MQGVLVVWLVSVSFFYFTTVSCSEVTGEVTPDKTHWLIEFDKSEEAEIEAMIARLGGTIRNKLRLISAMSVELPSSVDLSAHTDPINAVKYAEKDHRLTLSDSILDTIEDDQYAPIGFETRPWGLDAVGVPFVWNAPSNPTRGEGTTVCVIDSGIFTGHEDLVGLNLLNKDLRLIKYNGCNHGTHVLGTISSRLGNSLGIQGVAPESSIWVERFCFAASCECGESSDLMEMVERCIFEGNSSVISMSFGQTVESESERSLIEEDFWDAVYNEWDVLPIGSAGNKGNSDFNYPGSFSSVMSVASTDWDENHASFSQYNPQIDICAPGTGVNSTSTNFERDSLYELKSGTSMSVPHVSGLAALLFSANPNATAKEVRGCIESTAKDLGFPGRDDLFGHGLIQACLAHECITGAKGTCPENRGDKGYSPSTSTTKQPLGNESSEQSSEESSENGETSEEEESEDSSTSSSEDELVYSTTTSIESESEDSDDDSDESEDVSLMTSSSTIVPSKEEEGKDILTSTENIFETTLIMDDSQSMDQSTEEDIFQTTEEESDSMDDDGPFISTTESGILFMSSESESFSTEDILFSELSSTDISSDSDSLDDPIISSTSEYPLKSTEDGIIEQTTTSMIRTDDAMIGDDEYSTTKDMFDESTTMMTDITGMDSSTTDTDESNGDDFTTTLGPHSYPYPIYYEVCSQSDAGLIGIPVDPQSDRVSVIFDDLDTATMEYISNIPVNSNDTSIPSVSMFVRISLLHSWLSDLVISLIRNDDDEHFPWLFLKECGSERNLNVLFTDLSEYDVSDFCFNGPDEWADNDETFVVRPFMSLDSFFPHSDPGFAQSKWTVVFEDDYLPEDGGYIGQVCIGWSLN